MKGKLQVGLRCIYDRGTATIERVDRQQELAILRDEQSGNYHTRHFFELSPDDAQWHDENDNYY